MIVYNMIMVHLVLFFLGLFKKNSKLLFFLQLLWMYFLAAGDTASADFGVNEQIYDTADINGIYVSPEPSELGIYKSFNYEIFERRNSVVVAFDGNSPVSNLIQEAKNGKGKAHIYVNSNVESLRAKAQSLEGYVKLFGNNESLANEFLIDNPEIVE